MFIPQLDLVFYCMGSGEYDEAALAEVGRYTAFVLIVTIHISVSLLACSSADCLLFSWVLP